MTPDDLERYARHIMLREIGGPGQRRLAASDVLVVGTGGLGCPALQYLAAAGVGALTLVDDDRVSLSNLQRQILFRTRDVGRLKVDAAAEALAALNPGVTLTRLPERFAPEMVQGRSLVLDGTDDHATRATVNAACVAAGVPLLSAAMSQWEGQIGLYDSAAGGPCWACAFPEASPAGPSCAEAGVMGALPGVIGAMMATEAIKHIAGAGETLAGTLLIWDALHAEARRVTVPRRADCTICGPAQSIAGTT